MIRVEIIVHEGKRRSVAIFGLESIPEGAVMTPVDYELLRPKLLAKYGAFEEKEVAASDEMLAVVEEIRSELAHEGGNGQ